MVSTRRNTYGAGVEKKQPPPRQVQKKLRDKLEIASQEIEKAYDRVDQLEAERLDAGGENVSFKSQIASIKTELESVKQQRNELQQCIQQSFTQADRKAQVWRESALCLKDECDASRRREADKEQQVVNLEEQLTNLMQQLRAAEENAETVRIPIAADPLTNDEVAEIRRSALRSVVAGGDLEAALENFYI